MVARPLLRPPPADVRTTAAKVAALTFDRRRPGRRSGAGGAPAGPQPTVHPVGPLADDPEAAAVAAALAAAGAVGRRLLRPATLPAGLDPALDRSLAALAPDARFAVVGRCWLGWGSPRIASVLARPVPEVQALLAAALHALGRDPEAVGHHLMVRAAALHPRRPGRVPGRALATAGAAVVVVAVAMFAGAASAPLPTVGVPPELDLSLVGEPEAAAPLPPPGDVTRRVAAAGAALDWVPASMPAGVAFRWIVAADGGFVALGVDPAEATRSPVRPVGFWTSPDGREWRPLAADRAAFGPDDKVAAIAAGPAGLVAVGGEAYGHDAVVRPAAWRLAAGGEAWERAGLRTTPLGGPASIRLAYRDLAVVAADRGFVAHARGVFVPTGRPLPAGFTYEFDELGVTLRGPAGATLQRLGFDDIGLSGSAAARLVSGEEDQAAWRSQDGLRWEPLPVEVPRRLGTPAFAAGRFWSAANGTLSSSVDGQRWAAVDLGGHELGATAVAGHPGGVIMATGGRTLVGADASGWYALVLPDATNALTGARWVAGGRAGVAAYGTMGSDAGAVVVPQVTVPGRDGVMEADLFTGGLEVVGPDGAVRHFGLYYAGGTFRADFARGVFQVVDGVGSVQLTGQLDDWAAAVAAAQRTPYPPEGPIAVWFSADGEGWSLQDVDARGFPSAVAVGDDRVVVAAVQPGRPDRPPVAQLWVGMAEP